MNNLLTLWNEGEILIPQLSTSDIDSFAAPFEKAAGKTIRDSLTHQSVPGQLRLSQIGRPIHVLAYSYFFGLSEHIRKMDMRSTWNFLQGNLAEELVLQAASIAGDTILGNQEEVTFCNVTGHIDGYIELKLGYALVEIKSMSNTYWTAFVRQPNDDRGYLTQAACYCEGLRAKYPNWSRLKTIFLCLNKATGELAAVSWRSPHSLVKIAERKIRFIQSIKDYVEIFKTYPLPSPVPELKAKKPTGRWLPPAPYQNYAELFYPMEGQYVNYAKYQRDLEYHCSTQQNR